MKRILIIEDDRDIVELVRYNLANEGFQVQAASTAPWSQYPEENASRISCFSISCFLKFPASIFAGKFAGMTR